MVLSLMVEAPGVAVVAVLSEVAAAFVLTDPGRVLLIIKCKLGWRSTISSSNTGILDLRLLLV